MGVQSCNHGQGLRGTELRRQKSEGLAHPEATVSSKEQRRGNEVGSLMSPFASQTCADSLQVSTLAFVSWSVKAFTSCKARLMWATWREKGRVGGGLGLVRQEL